MMWTAMRYAKFLSFEVSNRTEYYMQHLWVGCEKMAYVACKELMKHFSLHVATPHTLPHNTEI